MLKVLEIIVRAAVLISALLVIYIVFLSNNDSDFKNSNCGNLTTPPPCPPDLRKKSNKLPNNITKQSTHDAETARLKSVIEILRIQKKQARSVFHVTEHKMTQEEFDNLMLRYERRALLLGRLLEKYREDYGR